MAFPHAWRMLATPRYWPRRMRRLFVILLPVTFPLWLSLTVGLVFWGILQDMIRPVTHFWNAPRRIRIHYYYRE